MRAVAADEEPLPLSALPDADCRLRRSALICLERISDESGIVAEDGVASSVTENGRHCKALGVLSTSPTTSFSCGRTALIP